MENKLSKFKYLKPMDKNPDRTREHTFVIPCYGDSPFLPECIASLGAQTVKSGILLTTATPSEYLAEIARQYNLPLLINTERHGIAGDWNFALRSCKTRYCTLAHQDDIYLPEYTEKIFESAAKTPDFTIAFCDYRELKNNSSRYWLTYLVIKRTLLTPFYFRHSWQSTFIKKAVLRLGCPICCPSVTYNLDFLEDFSFNSKFTVNLDWDAWLQLAGRKGRFVFVPEALMQHRISRECETVIGMAENRRQNEDRIIFERLWPRFVAAVLVRLYQTCYISLEKRRRLIRKKPPGMTKISVITAVYNGEKYIRETVESVLSQKGDFGLEYIVCDGQSTDRTLEILDEYRDSCRIISRADDSPQNAINYGMELAAGDIACWLNADDTFTPGALEAVVKAFEKHPERRWLYGQSWIIDSQGKKIRRFISFYKNLIGFFYSRNMLLCENFISQPSTFWKLDFWREVKGLDPQYKAAWDYELWLNMARKSRPLHLRKNLSRFRRHKTSISTINFVRQFDEELVIARKHGNFIHYLIHAFNRWKITRAYKLFP